MAENDHLPLTWHIALTTVYALTCYTVIWLLIDVCLLLLHVSFIFDCLVYFFHYSVLRVRFYNKIKIEDTVEPSLPDE